MPDLFSDDVRRNPYPVYAQLRQRSPLFHVPPPFDGWVLLDYDTAKWALSDHEAFSSRVPAPRNWFIFTDPPLHTRLRGLISRAFTPRIIAGLESRIREISREFLHASLSRGEIDVATELAIPLAMKVIATMIGIPEADWARYRHWSDVILQLSYTRSDSGKAQKALSDFAGVTAEMSGYLAQMIGHRSAEPRNDLLTRLVEAEFDGERLSHEEILGFVQLLIVAGQETSSDLISNAVLCLLEYPQELAKLRTHPELLPSAIEEVLRFRAPLQWMMRTPRNPIEVHGQTIPPGALVLPMIGAANRDPGKFPNPETFDITRDPNPHLAFGHGVHFCIGAALSRLEAKVVVSELLGLFATFELATSEPLKPRSALHVHGPMHLPIRFHAARHSAAG